METVTLNNGMEMPLLGFGTYQLDENATAAAVLAALKTGYRLIDTAQYYGNEQTVGQAIRQSGIGRDQLFITTKTPLSGYAEAKAGVDDSLMACGVDYLDLMLIHWPVPNFMETYEALEDTVKEGKVRSIGLSNFDGPRLDDILSNCDIPPSVIQVECHPFYQQDELKEKLKPYGTVVESWYPIGHGDRGLIENPVFGYLGRKYGKSNVQAILRWHIQEGNIVFPGSRNPEHIRENLDIFDFSLTDDEMREIKSLDCDTRYYNLPYEQQSQYLSWNPGD